MANNVNVVNRGFEYLCQYMALPTNNSSNGGWTVPTVIGWGGANGYNAASAALPASQPSNTIGTGQWSDIAPYQEFAESRTVCTGAVSGNTAASGTVVTSVVGTITSLSNQSVGESFLAFTATKPSAFTISGNQTSPTATLLTVTTSGALANQYFQMNNEVIKVASTATSNVWTIVRAQNGSTGGTAKTGDVVTFGNIPGAGNSNPSNGDLFAHAGFQALALNTNDSIQFTWQINVTS